MQYEQIGQGSQYPYPKHDIDPADKGAKWCMSYLKAAYYDWSFATPKGVFSSNDGNYQKNRMYGLGKQPISQYKKWMGVDEATNNTQLVVDWTVRSVISGYRDKAISRLMKEDYGIVATPIDMLAKTELDSYYSGMKAKLIVRDLLAKSNPELASHPLVSLKSGEPMDLEELEMRVTLGEQFNRSKDAELAIELGFYENNYKAFRRSLYEDLFDYGVAGCKDWLGDDNKAKFRRVNPECVVISYCKDSTFKDMVHAGEAIPVPLVELATIVDEEGNRVFTEEELQEFAGSLAGKFGNPMSTGMGSGWLKPYDKFKCSVLDLEFYTYNNYSYNDTTDENGNTDFRKAEYGRGKKSNKYKRKTIQYVYKCKWVVGTDKCYDWGMCYDQKRDTDLKKKAKTSLSFKFCAYNFYEMKAQSFMDRLVPYLDDYQLTMLKIQNFKNRAVPSGWWIDLDALESVALNKGGKNMEPKELLQMFFETGVLVGRSKDEAGNPQSPNWKPVIPIENTAASELAMFYQDLMVTIQAIERMTGYNDITSGNPNPKTLVPGYELANQSTTDALYPMAQAEEYLTEELARDVLCRMQQGLRKGGVSGYASSLNSNTLKFIELDPAIADRSYGIELQKRSTQQEKEWIFQQVQIDIQNGFLDTSDAIIVIYTHNAKEAMQILAYRVKKAKELAQKNQQALVQQQAEGNQQIAMQTAQAQQQALEMEYQFKLQMESMRIQGEIEKEKLRVSAQSAMTTESNIAKIQVQAAANQGKIEAAHVQNDGKVISTHLAGEHNREKQELANEGQLQKQQLSNQSSSKK